MRHNDDNRAAMAVPVVNELEKNPNIVDVDA